MSIEVKSVPVIETFRAEPSKVRDVKSAPAEIVISEKVPPKISVSKLEII